MSSAKIYATTGPTSCPPLADPGAPFVKSKRNESPSRYKFINLSLPRCRLHARSEIIIDHKPTTVGQQIAITIQVPAHVAIRVENEEADFIAARQLPDGCYRRFLERITVDQGNILDTPNRRRFFFRSLKIFLLGIRKCSNCPPLSTLTIFFDLPDSRAPNAAAIVDPPM